MLYYTTRKNTMYNIFFTYNLENSMDICIVFGKINIYS